MKKKRCYHIYTIKNIRTGQVYIGKSCQPLGIREKSHFKGLDHSPIDDDIQKYGSDCFYVNTEKIVRTPEQLDDAEQEVMSKYRKLGIPLYNVFYGRGHFQVLYKEGKRTYIYPSITQASNLTGYSEQWIRDECNNEFHHAKRIFFWADEKGRAIEDFIRKFIKPVRKVPRKVSKVLCVETGTIYKNQTEAAKAVDVNPKTICKVLLGLREKAAGYHWQRVEGDK